MVPKDRLKTYLHLTDAASISRRYFIIGFFDGILTMAGMIVGAFISGHNDSRLIITVGVATALAIGISSAWGAFEAERIEQKTVKRRREKHMLSKFGRNNIIDDAHKFAVFVTSLIHGIAPIFGSFILIIPYLIFPPFEAFETSIVICCTSLFILGAVMGRMIEENVFLNGLRMLLFGTLVMLLVLILNPTHVI
ncbi:MAG: VIT1/CCC1 transporter family protein [Archaeoglobaceae archaeon]